MSFRILSFIIFALTVASCSVSNNVTPVENDRKQGERVVDESVISRQDLVSVQYYLREGPYFVSEEMGPVMPASANFNGTLDCQVAEVAPEYQEAFSLLVTFNHEKESLNVKWHYIMGWNPKTEVTAEKTYGELEYRKLANSFIGKKGCDFSRSEPIDGPAPEYIAITLTHGVFTWEENGLCERCGGLGKEPQPQCLCQTAGDVWRQMAFFREDVVK